MFDFAGFFFVKVPLAVGLGTAHRLAWQNRSKALPLSPVDEMNVDHAGNLASGDPKFGLSAARLKNLASGDPKFGLSARSRKTPVSGGPKFGITAMH